VASRLKLARDRVRNDNYRVVLYFVTLGNVSDSHRKDADSLARKAKCEVTFEVIDGQRTMLLLRDYLDGVAPPIPTLDLEMEQGPHVRVNGVAQRYDDMNQIESWVFSMRGDAVAELFRYAGIRLFARNVRGFLGGSTQINQGMVKTLGAEPGRFFYYNNGITILCDEAVKKSRKGKDILQVSNPQVINGQQTTRTLSAHIEEAKAASVLVKVIQVSRSHEKSDSDFDDLVTRIVGGTNWQNAIKPSDLMANHRVQIDLERGLRKLGYAYIRKRQTKGEARAAAGGKQFRFIKKEEFAQVVAACEIDPVTARTASEKLFSDMYYKRVFPSSDAEFFLSRYWLYREIAWHTRGNKQRREGRWVTLNYLWSRLGSELKTSNRMRTFRLLCERQKQNRSLVIPLNRVIAKVSDATAAFFKAHRGSGDEEVDAPTFFKSKRAGGGAFAQFWKDQTVSADIAKTLSALDEFAG
jgi:hypothetical protein